MTRLSKAESIAASNTAAGAVMRALSATANRKPSGAYAARLINTSSNVM